MLFQFFGGLIKYAYKVHSDVSAAVDDQCSVSGNHSFRFFSFFRLEIIWKCFLEILSNEEWTAA